MRSPAILSLILIILVAGIFVFKNNFKFNSESLVKQFVNNENLGGPELTPPHPLSIEALKNGDYPGSDLVVEQELTPGSNYQRKIVSYNSSQIINEENLFSEYKSEGLKIYALLTIPNTQAPEGGYPVIVFNHGYIPPTEYRTTERYIAYTDAFSRAGYVLIRPDYRGHGNSEGIATGGYGTNDYSIDVLNAVSSIKKFPGINPEKIGMWGHSMGGSVTLKNMVVRNDVKAGVIWAGVVGSYPDLVERWRRRTPMPTPPGNANPGRSSWRQNLIDQFGEPSKNPQFWNSLSANSYLSDISGPLQLHHGTADTSVPVEMSQKLNQQLKDAGKTVEYYEYPGDDHNIGNNLGIALQRSVDFFDKYLK